MAYEYTTVTVDLTENGSSGATGTIYAELFHTVTLANNDTVAPQVYSATVTAGAATLTLPCTATALMNTNAPFVVTFVPTGGKRRTLGRIITTESATAVQLADLLEVGGSSAVPVTTYNIEATNLVTSSSIANLQAIRNQEDGARVLVQDLGLYRYAAASTAMANEVSIVTPASAVGRWIREIWGVDGLSVFNVLDYGAAGDGVADDSTAIQAALDAANTAGGGVVFLPRGTYRLATVQGTSSVLLRPRSNVWMMGEGDASVLKPANGLNGAGALTFNVIYQADDDTTTTSLANAKFSDFKVDCNGTNNLVVDTDDKNAAIGARKGSNITVERITVTNNPGRQTFSFGDNTWVGSAHSITNLWITDCRVTNVGTAVTGNTVQTDHSVIYAQADGFVCRGNVLRNTTLAAEATALEDHSSNADISGNVIENFGTAVNVVASVTDKKRVSYIGNKVEGCNLAFNFYQYTGFVMRDIVIEGNSFEVTGAVTPSVNMYTNVQTGIADVTFANNKFRSTAAVSASTYKCIVVGKAYSVKIIGNEFRDFLGPAVFIDTILSNAMDLQLIGNTVIDCGKSSTAGSTKSAFALNQTAGTAIKSLLVSGNRIANVASTYMTYGLKANADITRGEVRGNIIDNVTTEIECDGTTVGHLHVDHIGAGDPEGVCYASAGSRWIDKATGIPYEKATAASARTSWRAREIDTAAPAANAHRVGDITINRSPSTSTDSIGWVCVTAGTPGTFRQFGEIYIDASGTRDPASAATGTQQALSSFTVTGAALGDFVDVAAPYDLQGMNAWGYVSATDTVVVMVRNDTGGTIDLASGSWKVRVRKL